MQEGDRGESDSIKGGSDNGTGEERSSCDRRKDEGKKGSESRCVEREVNNKDGNRKKRGRGKRNNREGGRGKVNDQVDAKRRSYSESVIGTDKTLSKGEDVVVYLPGTSIEHVTERVENTLGQGQRVYVLVHIGTNNADREGTTRIVQRYRQLVGKLKKTRVEQIILSGILPVMGGSGTTYRNCKRMAINALVEQMCEEE